MGGSESYVGHLHVQVENPNIQAGQSVTGVIHFKLDTDIVADSLTLKFSGKEKCSWSETISDSSTSSTTHYTGKSVVVKQHFPVFLFANSRVAAGQYSFPFAFTTLPNLLGSFDISMVDSKAHIKYFLTAKVWSQSKIQSSKVELHITRLITESIMPISGLTSAKISTWCCLSQGNVQVRAFFNKNAFVPGEVAEVEAEVDNSQSQLDVTRIQCTLFRTLRLKNETNHSFTSKVNIADSYFARQIRAGEKAEGDQRMKLTLLIRDAQGELQNATTVYGQTVECVYTISLRAEMDGSCMCYGQTPSVERELLIYPLQQAMMQLPPIPENWHPMVMPMAQLQYQPGYQPSAPSLA